MSIRVHEVVIGQQARYTQASMAWWSAGINAMTRLRCVWASGRWDDVFTPAADAAGEILNDSVFAAVG
jgi:hypothetical protein